MSTHLIWPLIPWLLLVSLIVYYKAITKPSEAEQEWEDLKDRKVLLLCSLFLSYIDFSEFCVENKL